MRRHISLMGMPLDEWTYRSCLAHFGTGADWATLYDIRSTQEGQGHATTLLQAAKAVYEAQGKVVWGSVALHERMQALYRKVGIPEVGEEGV